MDSRVWNWTPKDDRTLRQMWRDDYGTKDIAAAIGCSERQVYRRRVDIGLEQRPIGWKPKKYRARKPTLSEAPTPPDCRDADKAFAAAIGNRRFTSLRFKEGSPINTPRVMPEADWGASSLVDTAS